MPDNSRVTHNCTVWPYTASVVLGDEHAMLTLHKATKVTLRTWHGEPYTATRIALVGQVPMTPDDAELFYPALIAYLIKETDNADS